MLVIAQVAASLSAALLGMTQPVLPAPLMALQSLVGLPTPVMADANPGGTVATQISGTVFRDFNSDGIMNTSGISPS